MHGVLKILNLAQVFSIAFAVDKSPLYEWYKGLDNENVIIAINCGADEATVDQGGIHYLPDQNFVGGVTSSEGGNQRWVMPNSEVYHSERWSDQDFIYKLPFDKFEDG